MDETLPKMDVWFWIIASLAVVLVGAELLVGVALGFIGKVRREESPRAYGLIVLAHAVVFGAILLAW